MKVSIIVAASANGVIGKDNDMPWHIPEDLKRFKEITTGHHVIMGRATFESIGKALPNRTIIVLTRDKEYVAPGCKMCHSLASGLSLARMAGEKEVFIAGGGNVYDQAIELADKIYLTRIQEVIEGDTYFPFIDFENTWRIENLESHRHIYETAQGLSEKEKNKVSGEYSEFLEGQYDFEFMNLIRKVQD